MKIDLRNKINNNKIHIKHILHRFYKYTDNDTGNDVDPIIAEKDDCTLDLDCEDLGNPFEIKSNFALYTHLIKTYGSVYDEIEINYETDGDGYHSQYQIIGTRLETDEECEKRIKDTIKQKELELQRRELTKLVKKQKKQEKELELLKTLNEKYK